MSSSTAPPLPLADDFPTDGLPPCYLRQLIDEYGGEAAFEGLTTSNVKRNFIVPKTQATKLSLCAQLLQEGDARVKPATWFVSHAWQFKFLDVVRALEAFFADKPDAIIWIDLMSTSQHATFDRPPEWWQQTFISAIGRMGQMVMVMTPWDNPICLTRAWCLIELYACRSSGSNFCIALSPYERSRFVEQICERAGAFYGMLSKVNTAKSECSRDSDRDRIFAAVRGLQGGFTGLDRSVLQTMTDWLLRQLEQEIAGAVAAGQPDAECRLMSALGGLYKDQGEYARALPLYEDCLAKSSRIFGEDHPESLASLNNVASLCLSMGEFDRALRLYKECLAKRRQILGEDHPNTLISLNHLAVLFLHMRLYDNALPLYEDCLARMKRVLGQDHPNTLASLCGLALLFERMGKYDCALPLHEECLANMKRVLGEDHPNTLTSLNNLALLFLHMRLYDNALPLYEDCLARMKRVLGEHHPNTLGLLNNIAGLFECMGQYDVALPLYEDCLARTTQALGEDHPNTQITLKLHKQCAKKVAHFARVESAMHFVDMSSAPLELLLKAKKHVLESVEGCNERM
jgi:tetratricopeptide (TPR) repeat protein